VMCAAPHNLLLISCRSYSDVPPNLTRPVVDIMMEKGWHPGLLISLH